MDKKAVKVLGAGSALLDLLVHTPESFIAESGVGEKGGMIMLDPASFRALLSDAEKVADVARVPGGSAANTLCGLARLGIPNALFGKIGDDSEGAFYRDSYVALGGDSKSFKVNPALPTGCCLSIVTPDSERTMRTCLAASGSLTPEDVTDADFDGVTHLHLEGYLLYNLPVFMKLLKTAKRHGCTVSFDLSSFEVVRTFRAELVGILRDFVDLVFANEDEACEFSGGTDPLAALDPLADLTASAVVKLGREGAAVRSASGTVRIPAELVPAVDTTGAGDLWQAGFLYGWLRGMPDILSGRFGAAAAAEVVRVTGAQIPEDRWMILRSRFHAMETDLN